MLRAMPPVKPSLRRTRHPAVTPPRAGPFHLAARTLGALPVINHFLDRLRLDTLWARYVPSTDRRYGVAPASALGVLLRNILVQRAPVYGLQEWAASLEPAQLRLAPHERSRLNDDRVGRALDRLFDADRASLLTEGVVRAVREFQVDLEQLHNDSTTVTFSGQYTTARGAARRGRPTLRITQGYNKDHRPDLKQLLWILTVSADGAVPVHFRTCDGNTTDDQTHIQTWEAVRRLVGRPDFLVRRRQQALHPPGPHAPRRERRALPHGAAADPPRGRLVPRLGPDPPPRLGRGAPPPASPPGRGPPRHLSSGRVAHPLQRRPSHRVGLEFPEG